LPNLQHSGVGKSIGANTGLVPGSRRIDKIVIGGAVDADRSESATDAVNRKNPVANFRSIRATFGRIETQ
jgi:hypothetical protein